MTSEFENRQAIDRLAHQVALLWKVFANQTALIGELAGLLSLESTARNLTERVMECRRSPTDLRIESTFEALEAFRDQIAAATTRFDKLFTDQKALLLASTALGGETAPDACENGS